MSETTTTKIGTTLFSGSATVGTIYATISLITGIIVGVIMIAFGIGILLHRSHLKSVSGTVKSDSTCTSSGAGKDTTTLCSTTITYKIDGKSYNEPADSGIKKYKSGDNLTVYYSPSTPANPELSPVPKAIGWGLIAFAILIVSGASINYYFVTKSKAYAAVVGITGTL